MITRHADLPVPMIPLVFPETWLAGFTSTHHGWEIPDLLVGDFPLPRLIKGWYWLGNESENDGNTISTMSMLTFAWIGWEPHFIQHFSSQTSWVIPDLRTYALVGIIIATSWVHAI